MPGPCAGGGFAGGFLPRAGARLDAGDDATLACIELAFVAGREQDDPRFAITGVPTEFTVPEPGTWGLAMLAVLLGAASRRRSPPLQETPA